MPIIVLGIGRCGSSLTAKVLEERLGYDMGGPGPNGPAAPLGIWEDRQIHKWTQAIEAHKLEPAFFPYLFGHYVRQKQEPWGFKAPRIAYVLPYVTQILPEATYIWCDRSPHDCAESAVNRWGQGYDRLIYQRWETLKPWLKRLPHHRLDFNKHWTEDEIEAELRRLLDL